MNQEVRMLQDCLRLQLLPPTDDAAWAAPARARLESGRSHRVADRGGEVTLHRVS